MYFEIVWFTTSCSLVYAYSSFEEKHCFHLQGGNVVPSVVIVFINGIDLLSPRAIPFSTLPTVLKLYRPYGTNSLIHRNTNIPVAISVTVH
jgi:hypothetical protein